MLFAIRHTRIRHTTKRHAHHSHARGDSSGNSEGSALLVALIIMGILLTVAIGVSELLIRSYKDNRQLIDRTGAWYEAEAGIETALLQVTHNPPGFQIIKENEFKDGPDDSYYHGYEIKAAGIQVPEQLFPGQDPEEQFNEIKVGETVTIPLFSGTDPDNGVTDLKIEFELAPQFKQRSGNFNPASAIPILRWKIFGRNNTNQATEVISDIAPEENGQRTCIGTPESTDICPYQGGKYFQKDGDAYLLSPQYFISSFLREHKQNFLLLTNMVDVNFIDAAGVSPSEKKKLAVIRYRVTQLNDQDKELISLPTATITADGFARNTKQSIDIELNRERSLPVFNYALYRTE